MILSVEQAKQIFSVITIRGNISDSDDTGYMDYKEEQFIHSATTGDGISEYWYSSEYGSSFKLYFEDYNGPKVTFHAQTLNPIMEAHVKKDMQFTLDAWCAIQGK